MPPVGCTPPVLAVFDAANSDQLARYINPRTGCLDEANELTIRHNSLLLESIEKIQAEHPEDGGDRVRTLASSPPSWRWWSRLGSLVSAPRAEPALTLFMV
jgi:hypothetical protein